MMPTITTITAARAQTLYANGYRAIGRYLTNTPVADPLDKNIKPGELATIFANNLRVFPIFQEGGTDLSYFSKAKGLVAGQRAYDAAIGYGFKRGTVIYFAVDDIRYARETLASRGVSFRREPHKIATLADREVWLADFQDSEGNTLALMSEPKVSTAAARQE